MKFWQVFDSAPLIMRRLWQRIGVGIGLMGLGLLSACGGASVQPEAVSQPVSVDEVQSENDAPIAEAMEETVANTEASEQAVPVTEVEQPSNDAGEAPAEVAVVVPTTEIVPEIESEPPTARPLDQFYPTDPATVSLASGQVQLVEFFAFW
ncbi:MAG: hypothetical protein KDJ65_13425 [Anaerolineae bacterium]|nr:hypothetical protein [Anaerolineae bacterium]